MNKEVALIIAPKDFRDEEYFLPREILEKEGYKVTTVSTKKGVAIGLFGGEAKVEATTEELKEKEVDAIVLVGGPGAPKHLDIKEVHEIVFDHNKKKKAVGAICVSPIILAGAGILEGKRATVWHSEMEKTPISKIKERGAIYEDEEVVREGNIVTANGPEAAEKFTQTLIKVLQGN